MWSQIEWNIDSIFHQTQNGNVIRWSNHDKTLTFYNWTLNDLSYVCTFWRESLDLLTIYRRARAWAFGYKKEHTYVLRKVYPNIRLTCRQEIVLYVGNVDLKFSKWQDTIEYANDWPVICIDIMYNSYFVTLYSIETKHNTDKTIELLL